MRTDKYQKSITHAIDLHQNSAILMQVKKKELPQ